MIAGTEEASVRAGYDAMAAGYAERFRHQLAGMTLDRAMLAAFAERVTAGRSADGPRRVADVGCGTGRVTGHLRDLGLDAFGVDLSLGMLREARRDDPRPGFVAGSMTALPLPDRSLAAALAWYSLIHVEPGRLPVALAELARVTVPGGPLLVAFQVGDQPLHLTEAFGHRVDVLFHRLDPDRLTAQLEAAGFAVDATLRRAAAPEESAPQAFVLAHRSP